MGPSVDSAKACQTCQRVLPTSFFARDTSRHDGLMGRCLECDRKRNREYYARTGRRSSYTPKPAGSRKCKGCGGLASSTRHHYCDRCRAASERKRNSRTRPVSTTARGYGSAHQKERKEIARVVDAGRAICARCAEPIIPGEYWDLDHFDDRSGYRGPAHRHCNRSAGAVKGNRQRGRAPAPRASRQW